MLKNTKLLLALLVILLAGILAGALILKETQEEVPEEIPEEIPGKIVDFETISKGYYSSQKKASNYAINDIERWTEIWNLAGEIDFSKETVIAVFMGEFPTGGFSIEIKEIREDDDKIIVRVETASPEPGSPVTQALSQPYHIVKTRKILKSVIFEE